MFTFEILIKVNNKNCCAASATTHHFQACCTRPPSPHFCLYKFGSKWPPACLVVMAPVRQHGDHEFLSDIFCLSVTFPSWPTSPLHPQPVYGPVALQSTTTCLVVPKYYSSFFFSFYFLKIENYMLDWHYDSGGILKPFTNY